MNKYIQNPNFVLWDYTIYRFLNKNEFNKCLLKSLDQCLQDRARSFVNKNLFGANKMLSQRKTYQTLRLIFTSPCKRLL